MKDLLEDIKKAVEQQRYYDSLKHEKNTAWGIVEWSHIYEQVKQ